MKNVALLSSLLWLLALPAVTVLGQRQLGIPFEEQNGFVLEIEPPYESILLDLGDNPLRRDSAVELELTSETRVLDPEGRAVEASRLRAGFEVSVRGQKLGSRLRLDELRLLQSPEEQTTKVSGVYEKLDGRTATVGGQLVVLGEEARIEGSEQWKGMVFDSFDEMMLGSFVEVEGSRDADGRVRATGGETWPNVYTELDQEVRATYRNHLDLPASNRLSGGTVQIADEQFRLVEDLELQAYVTRVGYDLVPDYLRDLPDDDPAKVLFRFYVIDDPSFNAFAYPDGSVFVHTGLLQVIENEAQLAAVLGHEIAHVTHEHGRRQYQRAKKVETGKKVAKKVGGLLGKLGKVNPFKKKKKKRLQVEALGVDETVEVGLEDAIDFGVGLFSNMYSRKMENQADRVGLFYMHEAGYDPREAPKVWREIVDQTGPQGRIEQIKEKVETALYSSHPAAKRRLSHLNLEIARQWHDTDFSRVEVGVESYREAVARRLGGR